MNKVFKTYIIFSLTLLISALVCGVLAAWSFLYPENYKYILPFQQLRPFHVSSAVFWILTGATGSIFCFTAPLLKKKEEIFASIFMTIWMIAIVIVFICYSFGLYGGREYWEYPPAINIILLLGWLFLIRHYWLFWKVNTDRKSVYIWMWLTGIVFFLFTFIEQNLWNIDWFRATFLKEMTVQWKSNGSMVGAWNQMIYGTSIYLMVQISGNKEIATSKWAYGSYFLGLTNLIFNWGHHIYNIPTANWERTVAYSISMTEWIFVIGIIQNFKAKLFGDNKHKHLLPYRFLIAAEVWVSLNLLLALMMSIPAVNRYTHGTHITVAHAMGTTIGINTMLLLASFSFFTKNESYNGLTRVAFRLTQLSLFIFWTGLIVAGILKGYLLVEKQVSFIDSFAATLPWLSVVFYAGIALTISFVVIIRQLFKKVNYQNEDI